MATKPVNISLDEALVVPIEKDRGPASMSGFINYILGMIYSPETPLARDLEKFRKMEGLRDVPEAARILLMEGLDKKLKDRGIK